MHGRLRHGARYGPSACTQLIPRYAAAAVEEEGVVILRVLVEACPKTAQQSVHLHATRRNFVASSAPQQYKYCASRRLTWTVLCSALMMTKSNRGHRAIIGSKLRIEEVKTYIATPNAAVIVFREAYALAVYSWKRTESHRRRWDSDRGFYESFYDPYFSK